MSSMPAGVSASSRATSALTRVTAGAGAGIGIGHDGGAGAGAGATAGSVASGGFLSSFASFIRSPASRRVAVAYELMRERDACIACVCGQSSLTELVEAQ